MSVDCEHYQRIKLVKTIHNPKEVTRVPLSKDRDYVADCRLKQ